MAARCHPLPGDIPDEDQLAAKVDVLQEKLNEKRELLLERNLVLDEVVSLVDTLRTKAADGRSSTLDVAKKINEYQARIRALTQKMMATVSELSMYASGGATFFLFFFFRIRTSRVVSVRSQSSKRATMGFLRPSSSGSCLSSRSCPSIRLTTHTHLALSTNERPSGTKPRP